MNLWHSVLVFIAGNQGRRKVSMLQHSRKVSSFSKSSTSRGEKVHIHLNLGLHLVQCTKFGGKVWGYEKCLFTPSLPRGIMRKDSNQVRAALILEGMDLGSIKTRSTYEARVGKTRQARNYVRVPHKGQFAAQKEGIRRAVTQATIM